MSVDPKPGQPCYAARLRGCTCTWLRGFGVGPIGDAWDERIIQRDVDCPVDHTDDVIDET